MHRARNDVLAVCARRPFIVRKEIEVPRGTLGIVAPAVCATLYLVTQDGQSTIDIPRRGNSKIPTSGSMIGSNIAATVVLRSIFYMKRSRRQ